MFGNEKIVELRDTITELQESLAIEKRNRANEASACKEKVMKLEQDIIFNNRMKMLEIEEAKNEIRRELMKDAIEADQKRIKAESALATYEKLDTKEERKHIQEMLQKAIEGLSKGREMVAMKV